jgi:ABC-type dipeptide/oligopeptide/nickel transport system permease component
MTTATPPSGRVRMRGVAVVKSQFARYIVRRLALAILTIWLVSVAVFAITNILPGNPALVRLGPFASAEALRVEEIRMGLDRPLLERYFTFVGGALHGDLGISFKTERPVTQDLGERLPATLELALAATLLASRSASRWGSWQPSAGIRGSIGWPARSRPSRRPCPSSGWA